MIFNSPWWSVELPSDWTAEQDHECVTFSNKRCPGALQFSAYRKERDLVADHEIREFAKERVGENAPLQPVVSGLFTGLGSERLEKGVFWREWWLRAGTLMIYVSYNAAERAKDAERPVIDGIVNSVKPNLEHAGPVS